MSQTTYRNRHDRLEHHFGDLPATLVELSSAAGALTEGMTLQGALALIDGWLSRLEGIDDVFVGQFRADAQIFGVRSGSLSADAVFFLTTYQSLVADATVRTINPGTISSDAWFFKTVASSIAARACIITEDMVLGHITTHYVVKATWPSSSLGAMALGRSSLGGPT